VDASLADNYTHGIMMSVKDENKIIFSLESSKGACHCDWPLGNICVSVKATYRNIFRNIIAVLV